MRFLAKNSGPKPGVGRLGISMNVLSREEEIARNEGISASKDPASQLDHCPYDEQREPLLRAIWQDAFATARLYGGC